VKEDFNPDSSICADDFLSLEALEDYVLHPPYVGNRPSSVYDLNHLVDFFRLLEGARPNAVNSMGNESPALQDLTGLRWRG
jgi:hypothetical protein